MKRTISKLTEEIFLQKTLLGRLSRRKLDGERGGYHKERRADDFSLTPISFQSTKLSHGWLFITQQDEVPNLL